MEEKLFWISLVFGAFAFVLRWRAKKSEFFAKEFSLAHGVLLALAGGAAGVLAATYYEKPEMSWPLSIGLAVGGFVVGWAWRAWFSRTPESDRRLFKEDLEWADTGFSAVLLAAVIMYFIVQAFKIPSGSMRLTLLEGDHLFVNKFIYGTRIPYTPKRVLRWKPVERGDVVVFHFPSEDSNNPHYGKDFIKRAIGLPGDVLEIKNKKIWINGSSLEEPYTQFVDDFIYPPLSTDTAVEFQSVWESGALARQGVGEYYRDNFGPVTVPPGHYFMMGDNRDRSFDSRFWGPLPEHYIKGRAWVVYWPLSRKKVIH